MRKASGAVLAGTLVLALSAPGAAATPERVSVTGEIIDSWCYLTEIMYPEGSAHHECALWCAAGGIPVGLRADDGTVYIILKVGDDATSVANPRLMTIQSHEVSVEGDVFVRDGFNYLVIDQVTEDAGIVNLTHEDYGIQPSGE
jgi:hypothetical protein